MRIVKLSIHNFLGLKDVEVNPTQTNVIVGKNKAGKTSILKAIKAAFTGDADSTMIRVGQQKAEITVDVEDLTIKRTITGKGNYLDVSNSDGFKMPAPQKYLDGILGVFSFNPVAFFEQKAVDRKKYLLNAIKLTITQDELAQYTGGDKLAGLDYENTHALEIVAQATKYYYDKRTVANAEVSKKEKSLQDITATIPEGFDPNKVTEEQIGSLRDVIEKDEVEMRKKDENTRMIGVLESQEKDLLKQLEELQERIAKVQIDIAEKCALKFDFSDPVSMSAAKETLKVLESQREFKFASKRAEEIRVELTEAMKEQEKLDVVVKNLKNVPSELIKKAELPIEGLEIVGDDIVVAGVSVDNMSSSEQLKIGIKIAQALNQKFKIICADRLECLDAEMFELFLKEMADSGYQLFVTRVDDTPRTGSWVMDDGEVKK